MWTTLGVGLALAVLGWRGLAYLDKKIDGKADSPRSDLNSLAREFSEFRGEMRGRFGLGNPDAQLPAKLGQ